MNVIHHSSSDITKNDINAVIGILEKNFVGYGDEVCGLERDLSNLIGVDYVYAVNSGSAALDLAFKLLNLPKGSKVIVTTYACIAVVNAICAAGLKPFFVDVGNDTVNADVEKIINACQLISKPGAILYPHIGGYAAEIDSLKRLNIPIIEDCASSLGATVSLKKPIGGTGDIAIFSFGSTKIITGGNGGAIATRDYKQAKKLEYLLNYEQAPSDYVAAEFSLRSNERLSNLCATLARSQLSTLNERIAKRRLNALLFAKALGQHVDVTLPKLSMDQCSFWRFIFFSPRKADWIDYMKSLGIDARPSISHQLHRYFGLSDEKFPNSRRVDDELISLPVHTRLSIDDVNRIVNAIESFK